MQFAILAVMMIRPTFWASTTTHLSDVRRKLNVAYQIYRRRHLRLRGVELGEEPINVFTTHLLPNFREPFCVRHGTTSTTPLLPPQSRVHSCG